jgi:hypothetical protein
LDLEKTTSSFKEGVKVIVSFERDCSVQIVFSEAEAIKNTLGNLYQARLYTLFVYNHKVKKELLFIYFMFFIYNWCDFSLEVHYYVYSVIIIRVASDDRPRIELRTYLTISKYANHLVSP